MSDENITSNTAPLKVRYVDLTVDRLDHTDSIMLMGALCARVLREYGQITLYIDREMKVQKAGLGELELDGIQEEDAIKALLSAGYDDKELINYLKGREDRLKRREFILTP